MRRSRKRPESDLPGEPLVEDEYTNDELAQEQDVGLPEGPFSEGVYTGGAMGEEEFRETVKRDLPDTAPRQVPGWDSVGEVVWQDPALAGTVAGNTTAAGASVGWAEEQEAVAEEVAQTGDEITDEVLLDLGPTETPIQEVGGEARH